MKMTLLGTLVLASAAVTAAIQPVAPFKDGERVVFLGDSITHGGRYVGNLQLFWDARHPGSNVILMCAGVSGDTAGGGFSRLSWDVLSRKPDRVFVLFGMNDVARGAEWSHTQAGAGERAGREKLVDKYVENMTKIVKALKEKGVAVVLMTPTPYDEYSTWQTWQPKAPSAPYVNSIGLATLADEARRLAREEDLGLVELFWPMTEIITRKIQKPLMPDRVHPSPDGHLVMAALILEAMGEKGVAPQVFDASQGARSFAYAPKTLPFPEIDSVKAARALTPAFDAVNREPLRFTGLPEGSSWCLKADGRSLGVYSAEELAEGVDAARLDLPAARKAKTVGGLPRDRFLGRMGDCRSIAAREFSFRNKGVDMEDEAAVRKFIDESIQKMEREKSGYLTYYRGVYKKFLELYPRRHELAAAEVKAREELAAACTPAEPCTLTLEPPFMSEPPALADAKLDTFLTEIYGRRPVERPAELSFETLFPTETFSRPKRNIDAVRKIVRCRYRGPYGEDSFRITAFLPKDAKKPVPAFLFICNRDPGRVADVWRVHRDEFFPAEDIVARGYAVVYFWNEEVAPDSYDNEIPFRHGVFRCFEKPGEKRADDAWGALSAWAWGASRVMDWIETDPAFDAKHVAVIGHSRCGKAALVAGITDKRFAMTVSNCSGCGGAKLNRLDLPASEHFANMKGIAYWFCRNFTKWMGREWEMPVDQHQWLSLVAPRLLCVGSGTTDYWAGPIGERLAADLARPAWGARGKDDVGYHAHPGKHGLTLYDWNKYMDFADAHGWTKGE